MLHVSSNVCAQIVNTSFNDRGKPILRALSCSGALSTAPLCRTDGCNVMARMTFGTGTARHCVGTILHRRIRLHTHTGGSTPCALKWSKVRHSPRPTMRCNRPCSAHTIVRALAHLDTAPGMDFVLVEAWLFSSAKPVASDTLLSAS